MSFPIRLPVSRLTYDRLHYTRKEVERLYGLPDRWLAEELLRLCREIRKATMPSREGNDNYNGAVLWDVIPEVAYRLGARLELNESTDYDLKRSVGQDFRDFVAICMVNVSVGYLGEAETNEIRNPLDILFREAANGNPVAMALDRIVPPTAASTDRFARSLMEVCRCRGFGDVSAWRPEVNVSGNRGVLELVPEDEPVPAPHF